ncbi:MAG: 4Fe-4S dicluster domain-containing protein [Deltaproteobacteria bacterium]|nr:4Fe-4S dicluster domain-containing protein [Deltaproteobacteria bacterium]MBW1957609.1 4Fe-4S dicluster domain-containing protein [Deltaproteobacteria bacterium]MBW2014208.1 4Fe-4S dicluster domain-containing protein [Deltaproteobacteria bacterium]MBW2088050.1 4Fe-4S dicluster domain-containing protein [Deltaproteobacteria bacterium]MBW2320403.1 4Fe-4S dicluster domain-containing protein [Deltaproteobacteria bacterium]
MSTIHLKKTAVPSYVARYSKPEHTRSCYTCGTCNSACPVNAATSRLRPLELVYKAKLGLLDELLSIPDIWYCIGCNRCSNLCPMMVEPLSLIQNLRAEAILRKIVRPEVPERHKELLKGLLRGLWHAADALLGGEHPDVAEHWDQWTRKSPFGKTDRLIKLPTNTPQISAFRQMVRGYGVNTTSLSSCFTCRECSNACPICMDPSVFDPLKIFRLANFGLKDDLLRSPSIWLCLDCQSCMSACSQGVKGALIIRQLQHIAYKEGFVAKDFPVRWQELKGEVYGQFIREIDKLLEPVRPVKPPYLEQV